MDNDTHALETENMGISKSKGLFGQNKSRGKSKFRDKIKAVFVSLAVR